MGPKHFSHLHGKSASVLPQGGKFSPLLTILLYSQILIFSASYVYQPDLGRILGLLKWVPVLGTFVLFATLALQKRVHLNESATVLFLGLLISAALSLFLSPYTNSSFAEFVGLSVLFFNALMLAAMIRSQRAINYFFDIISNGGRIVIGVSFGMAILGINLGRGQPRFSGWADNPNSLALIIAPTIIILFARYIERRAHRNTRYLPFLLAGLTVLIMTGSRASIGWVLISFLVFPILAMSSGTRSIFLLGSFLLFFALSDSIISEATFLLTRDTFGPAVSNFDALMSGRTEAWEVALDNIETHPFLGSGMGSAKVLLREHASDFIMHSGEHLHSSYLTVLVEMGAIGALILGLTLVVTIGRGFRLVRIQRREPTSALPAEVLTLALLVGALAHASVETWLLNSGNANSLMFWTLAAYIISSSRTLRAPPRPSTVHLR